MIQFREYPSIGNAADAAWMERVRGAVPQEALWAVQEKVDGANMAFLCDDLDVRVARRHAVLSPGESFFHHEQMLEFYSGQVYHVYNLVRLARPEMTSIAVYGELFGGAYPHPDVVAQPGFKPIQKDIWYSPEYDFYAFDIYVFTKSGGFFLPVPEANALFSTAGFLYARSLFVGPLEDCLAYPAAFQTTIPPELELPLLQDNRCEGIVLKPLTPVVLSDGTRMAVKKKQRS